MRIGGAVGDGVEGGVTKGVVGSVFAGGVGEMLSGVPVVPGSRLGVSPLPTVLFLVCLGISILSNSNSSMNTFCSHTSFSPD